MHCYSQSSDHGIVIDAEAGEVCHIQHRANTVKMFVLDLWQSATSMLLFLVLAFKSFKHFSQSCMSSSVEGIRKGR